MSFVAERAAPASPGSSPLECSLLGSENISSNGRNAAPMQAANATAAEEKIGLLVDDIGCNVGAIATLNAVLAMRDCGDTVGLVYGLRRSADAERLSVLRQGEAGRD